MEVEVRVGNLKNGKSAVKDEVTGWWTGFGGCVMWFLRVVLCQKTGNLI